MEQTLQELRENALTWWKSLNNSVKLEYWKEYQQWSPSHSPDDLTGREIQNIWAVKKGSKDK